MVILDSQNRHIYAYLKALDTREKENPEEKKTSISGWIGSLLKTGAQGDKVAATDQKQSEYRISNIEYRISK